MNIKSRIQIRQRVSRGQVGLLEITFGGRGQKARLGRTAGGAGGRGVEISVGHGANPGRVLTGLGDFGTVFIGQERRFPDRIAKVYFGSGFLVGELPARQVSSGTRVRPPPSGISATSPAGAVGKFGDRAPPFLLNGLVYQTLFDCDHFRGVRG